MTFFFYFHNRFYGCLSRRQKILNLNLNERSNWVSCEFTWRRARLTMMLETFQKLGIISLHEHSTTFFFEIIKKNLSCRFLLNAFHCMIDAFFHLKLLNLLFVLCFACLHTPPAPSMSCSLKSLIQFELAAHGIRGKKNISAMNHRFLIYFRLVSEFVNDRGWLFCLEMMNCWI